MSEISVLDFGSQYTQLIAKKIRKELNVYSKIVPSNIPCEKLENSDAIVLSGGSKSVHDSDAPEFDPNLFAIDKPILGICYGMQLLAKIFGGKVGAGKISEYGKTRLKIEQYNTLLDGLDEEEIVWMSHGDSVYQLPGGFKVLARSGDDIIGAIGNPDRKLYGLQFHPEVTHTPKGMKILENFVARICDCNQDWTMENYIIKTEKIIKEKAGDDHVLVLASGGVDSTVATCLCKNALGNKKIHVINIDNGLLRKNEQNEIKRNYETLGFDNLYFEDYTDRFINALAGITEPEQKRRIIGNNFIHIAEEMIKYLGLETDRLVQDTLYPDAVESGKGLGGRSAKIKSHHNVGGLPKDMKLKLIEPLRELFKDEVREVGRLLGIDKEILGRHPFPGPGLAIRILGEVTRERLDLLREVDEIYLEEIRKGGLYDEIWQAFAVLLPIHTVGVMGDQRTYESVIALRAVTSEDGMTADWYYFPRDVFDGMSNRIINEVKGVNKVVYDISSKPPSTIEWE